MFLRSAGCSASSALFAPRLNGKESALTEGLRPRTGAARKTSAVWPGCASNIPALPVIAYGNSASDLDHLRHADRALLVNGNSAARRLAAKWNIAVSYWN